MTSSSRITYLLLENFRRHAHTEIVLDSTDQLVFISGRNGAGKSSIVEAILWVLYNEGRTGRLGLDNLVRRGAEFEKMRVVLEFEIDGDTYRVERVRSNGNPSALLSRNGVDIAESADGVTELVSQILGMDVKGFRTAVLAQQKELDALARQSPAERVKLITRLLKLDAIESARADAMKARNTARTALSAMGESRSIERLEENLRLTQAEAASFEEERDEAAASLAGIDEGLNTLSGTEERYREAVVAHSRAEGAVNAAKAELQRIQADLDQIELPDTPDAPVRELEEISAELGRVEAAIATADAATRALEEYEEVEKDYHGVLETLAEHESLLKAGSSSEFGKRVAEATSTLEDEQRRLKDLHLKREEHLQIVASLQMQVVAITQRLDELTMLEASCDRCGQEIPDEHRHSQHTDATERLHATKDDLETAKADLADVTDRIEAEQEPAISSARDALAELEKAQETALRAEGQLSELMRRRDSYALRLKQRPVPVDVDALVNRRAELAIELAEHKRVTGIIRRVSEIAQEQLRLQKALTEATQRLAGAEAALTSARIPTDLLAQHEEMLNLREAREAEVALVADMNAELAGARERVNNAHRELTDAKAFEARRVKRAHEARIASLTETLLSDVHQHLSLEVRPSLAGTISELLDRMSEGRFTKVSVDKDYSVTVEDDGKMRALDQLSGGEVDLVALATRLALASVVFKRPGASTLGVLLLDECFGSQDPGRRQSIVSALRSLRSSYSQIWLISHVGGMEEEADKVIEVTVTADRTSSEVWES